MLFAKSIPSVSNQDHYVEALNDKDDRLMILYKLAQGQSLELLQRLKGTMYSQSDHEVANMIIKNYTCYTDLEVAWAYFVSSQQGFSNILGTTWGYSKSVNCAYSWQNRLKDLDQMFERLKYVQMFSMDALDCIDRMDSPDTLFYCDPPYPNARQAHYEGYTIDKYRDLIAKLKTIKGRFVLSNYPQYVDIPDNWRSWRFLASMSCANPKYEGSKLRDRTELVLSNAIDIAR